MPTTYTYSIANDTANGKAIADVLHNEIVAASISAPSHITTAGDVLSIVQPSALSGGDKTTQDNTVAAHTGVVPAKPTHLVAEDGKTYTAAISAGVATWTEVT